MMDCIPRRGLILGEVLFEMRPAGRAVRVIAIDPPTGTEVIAVCPANYPIPLMKRMAARKLRYALNKKRREALEKVEENENGRIV